MLLRRAVSRRLVLSAPCVAVRRSRPPSVARLAAVLSSTSSHVSAPPPSLKASSLVDAPQSPRVVDAPSEARAAVGGTVAEDGASYSGPAHEEAVESVYGFADDDDDDVAFVSEAEDDADDGDLYRDERFDLRSARPRPRKRDHRLKAKREFLRRREAYRGVAALKGKSHADLLVRAGAVTWFDAARHHGFLKPDDGGEDVFVHKTAVAPEAYPLRDGQRVRFSVHYDVHDKRYARRTEAHFVEALRKDDLRADGTLRRGAPAAAGPHHHSKTKFRNYF